MKNVFTLATIFAISQSIASSEMNLKCTAIHNLDKVMETEIKLKQTDKEKVIGEFEGFKFMVSSKGDNLIEIQSLNLDEPSRSYATGKVDNHGSYVELSVWNRNYILDFRCTP